MVNTFLILLVEFNFQVFNIVIETSEKNDDLNIRLDTLIKEITLSIYTNVSRGLFERHKLVFSFMLCTAIYSQMGLIRDSQWNYLLRGAIGSKAALEEKPDYPEISEAMWTNINFLSNTFDSFEKLPQECLKIIKVDMGNFQHVII